MKTPYRKWLTTLSIVSAFVLVLQSFTDIPKNPIVSSEIQVPDQVKNILKRACYDCHSNHSEVKWFEKIAPISFVVGHDIKEGRSRFNFSEWDRNPPAVQQVLLWEMVNAIEQGKMPLKRYTDIHPGARVSSEELGILKAYVNTLSGRSKIDTAKIIQNPKQLFQDKVVVVAERPTASNGVQYSEDYKKWRLISATDKYDGGSMRIVYGNEKMVQAIKNKQLPFPDGAEMVKVVWGKQQVDKNGNVFPGNFQNVQFMVKDSKKYKKTEGWGFARFDGLKLKPYGKAGFEKTCINCHRLLVPQNDYVFNIPTK